MASSTDARWGRAAEIPARRLLVVLAAVAFWGWLLAQWVNDWLLSRLGIGPGAGEQPLEREPVDAAADRLVASAEIAGPFAGILEFFGSVVGVVAVTVDVAPALAAGAWLTIVLTVVSILLGLAIAVPLTVVRVYGGPFRWLALGYIELIRGTPLLAQLFVLYFGLPLAVWLHGVEAIGTGPVPDQAFLIAIVGFTINSSAYQAEYIRGAVESVDPGQLTAARSIGLSRLAGIRYVVLPQTFRYAIPAWTNELVYLIKYSSLAAFITVPELYFRASRIASRTFEYTAIYANLAVVYIALVLTATALMSRLETRVAIPGLGQAEGRQQGKTNGRE
ncbi:amino acid ABC transporter permease [Natrononativus amylolyticus]|uniref:amino acid ABC transporter permease n=1 Tax=Natrononativus amylolyticus TaxID=2963434 RepID=UPI0020CE46C2|nr:amino acid ABC transporter permease [Natrononativus amylolyticus]